MIPRSSPTLHSETWQQSLARAIRDPDELIDLLELPDRLRPAARLAALQFPVRVPRGFAALMEKGNPDDPLLRQVLPLNAELSPNPGYSADPVGDLAAHAVPGLLHKYQGRALLITTPACAIHCRYCFRRHFPYTETLEHGAWERAADYLRQHPEIDELILSGGDPLSLNNHRLHELVETFRDVPKLQRLRLHTRLPIVLPERIDAGLMNWFRGLPWQSVVVLHSNHPNELGPEVLTAIHALREISPGLLNQSVLLRGVNDDAATLAELSRRLFSTGVLPYYLHLLDRVAGAAHFEVDEPTASQIYASLQRQLPGYLLPRLVRETPGQPSKTSIC